MTEIVCDHCGKRFDESEDSRHHQAECQGTYTPWPIDTLEITLNPRLGSLVEMLARNAHDNWAKLRLAEGWRYGRKRDDKIKTHPCLIDYTDLPDSEKEYDRRTAMETLKAIVYLGFVIRKG